MPVKRRRLRRSGRFDWDNLGLNDIFHLAYGSLPHRVDNSVFRTKDDLREAYEACRERLVTVDGLDDGFGGDSWHNQPGTRCRAFWKFEATERPKCIGWRTERFKFWMICANPLAVANGVKVGDRIGRHKVYECQEDVLRRIGAIGEDEEALLDAVKRKDAVHVRNEPADCRCRVHGKHRTYPHQLAPYLTHEGKT